MVLARCKWLKKKISSLSLDGGKQFYEIRSYMIKKRVDGYSNSVIRWLSMIKKKNVKKKRKSTMGVRRRFIVNDTRRKRS